MGTTGKLDSAGRRTLATAVVLALALLANALPAGAQSETATPHPPPSWRLLTVAEGRSIVSAAREVERPDHDAQDCSHLIHRIFEDAGFDYPYQSSFELYVSAENFARVKHPRAGDLIVWPGHVGIVVEPLQHSFFSLVSTGVDEQNYEGPYWKSRGVAHFYRYKVQMTRVQTASATSAPPRDFAAKKSLAVNREKEESSPRAGSGSSSPPAAASNSNPPAYGPAAPAEFRQPEFAFTLPSKIVVSGGKKPPTREEVAEGISELTDAAGSVLRSADPLNFQVPVVIVEEFSVERLEIKRDHGWAHLQISSKASIAGGTIQLDHHEEKVIWELRRTAWSWEALTPPNRAYVPHDVAVKNLAAQLARLTASDGAAAHQEGVLRQESQLVQLLSALVASK
jgi:NlpC/P60 family